jgi:hypothetical protein
VRPRRGIRGQSIPTFLVARDGRRFRTSTRVSNPTGDTGNTRTQDEDSIERNRSPALCSPHTTIVPRVTQGTDSHGYSRSVDGGSVWVDRGAVIADDSGDPSLVWRRLDGKFYYAALRSGGLALYRSRRRLASHLHFVSQIATATTTKEIMAIATDPTSPSMVASTSSGPTSAQAPDPQHPFRECGTTWSTQHALSGQTVTTRRGSVADDRAERDV